MPVAFAALGLAVLFVVSGLKGTTIAEVFSGRATQPLDPTGGPSSKAVQLDTSPDIGGAPDPFIGSGTALTMAGTRQFDGKPVALWIWPILDAARKSGKWKGTVQSGYRSPADQARVCATGVKPCAAPGTSNHQGKLFPSGAVDVTDAGGLNNYLQGSHYRGILVWAGTRDPVHFSHPHNGSY